MRTKKAAAIADPELEELELPADMDKYERWNHRAGTTGPYCQVMHSGINQWGKHRYAPDGFVYVGRSKTRSGAISGWRAWAAATKWP